MIDERLGDSNQGFASAQTSDPPANEAEENGRFLQKDEAIRSPDHEPGRRLARDQSGF
jgi:hypothetical protein